MELTLLYLIQGFAVYALSCCRPSFQSTQADLDAAGVTVAIVVLIKALNSAVDFLDQLAFTVSRTQFNAELFFLRRGLLDQGSSRLRLAYD